MMQAALFDITKLAILKLLVLVDAIRRLVNPVKGEVVAIGNGQILDNGSVRKLDLKVGDKILFGKYSGTEVKVDGEELVVMREDDIMAVFGA